MIDLHCHVLPDIDDGSRSMEETISILKKAENAGFDTICFTPHYADPQYLNTKIQNKEILERVKLQANIENINIKLLLGNEIFIHQNIDKLLEKGEISTLADSNYALIELPMYQKLPQEVVQTMLNPVREKGYKVVIAHPERYLYFQENPKEILEYLGDDVFYQANYASILGAYGKEAQKAIKKLLKEKVIHYFSSDVHQIYKCFYDEFDEIKKKLLKIVDEEYFELMTEINPKLIIENSQIIKVEKG